jgi:hypothetical protein
MGTRPDNGDTETPVKCSVCHRGIQVDCEWRQGRCPRATDHNLACTNSNEPGQPGSRY